MRTLIFAAALTLIASFASAETLPQPPEIASPNSYQTNTVSVVLTASPAEAWAFWRSNPITNHLEPTDRIPAIDSFEVLQGSWGEPGSVRRVNFVGGGSALERVLTSTDSEFTYQIWNIETPSGRFINHIYGTFEARPADGGGTEISWSYNVKPRTFLVRPFIASFLRNDFGPFMEGGMRGMANAFSASGSG